MSADARFHRRMIRILVLAATFAIVVAGPALASESRVETREYNVGVLPTECGANVLLSAEVCFDILPGDEYVSLSIAETSPAALVGGPIRAWVVFENTQFSRFEMCDHWDQIRIPPTATTIRISIASGNCTSDLTERPGIVVQGIVRAEFVTS